MRTCPEETCTVCFAPLSEGGPDFAHWAALEATPDNEIEIKLKASPETLQRIAESDLVREFAAGPLQVKQLETHYFDTPQFTLRNLDLTLRMRKKGEGWIQTLKTHVQDPVCLFHRQEWTCKAAEPVPDLSAIPLEAWPDNQCPVNRESLVPMFHTEITRTRVDLNWSDPNFGTAVIELCLDQGRVVKGTLSAGICEVELELKQGTQGALFTLEDRFRDAFAIECETESKSDRGFALVGHTGTNKAA